MNRQPFLPTDEQRRVIEHEGSAFVRACPGAGKTRVIVERARRLFQSVPRARCAAFLSFTQAAVFELETRLRSEGLVSSSIFPSFIGTFDSFVWQFIVAPFGIPECDERPRLVPDINLIEVIPFPKAHPLPLYCFCPETGEILEQVAKRTGFDVSQKPVAQLQRYTTAALQLRVRLRAQGQLDFDEARAVAINRLSDDLMAKRIAKALAARFSEVIVDEAQDCNPGDLRLISWLRDTGIAVKVVCDPNQSIYKFRGGVTEHLSGFAESFPVEQNMCLTGNFRSTPNICRAIVQFRASSSRSEPDDSLGALKTETTGVELLSYQAKKVPSTIGKTFSAMVKAAGIDLSSAPIVAATKRSGAEAAGQSSPSDSENRTIRLAEAVSDFQFASGFSDMKRAIDKAHQVFLELEGHLIDRTYYQFLTDQAIEPASWRSEVVSLLRALQFNPVDHANAKEWHAAAKSLLSKELKIGSGQSISQRLKWNGALDSILVAAPDNTAMPRTIHSVKGMEFPAVCVVTTRKTIKGILDFLNTGSPAHLAEESRKLYVAASRAEILLSSPCQEVRRNGSEFILRNKGQ